MRTHIMISKEEADFRREQRKIKLQKIGSNHDPMITIPYYKIYAGN